MSSGSISRQRRQYNHSSPTEQVFACPPRDVSQSPPGLAYICNLDTMGPPPASPKTSELEPRVPVTASMLCAYSYMHGPLNEESDPVYGSLYPAAGRDFRHPVRLPAITNRESMEKLPRAATFFWDPLTLPTTTATQPGPSPVVKNVFDAKNSCHPGSPKALKAQSSKSKHYKGDEVYANFGYVQIDGKWVDPESEGELYNAYVERCGDPSWELDVAERHGSRDNGPRILTAAEQDDFYREFILDVTDTADGEGDPRDYRISPETFARWAEGAARVGGYIESLDEPTLPDPPTKKGVSLKNSRSAYQPQFDEETGSTMSETDEQSSDPSLVKLPRGVNLNSTSLPEQFAKSYPLEMRGMSGKAFGRARREKIGNWMISSVETAPVNFSSKEAAQALADENGIAAGAKRFREAGNSILDLYEQNIEEEAKIETKLKRLYVLHEHKTELHRKIQKLGVMSSTSYRKTRNSSAIRPPSDVDFQEASEPLPSAPQSFPQSQLRRRYERHLSERLAEERARQARNKMVGNKIDFETQTLTEDVDELQRLIIELLLMQGASVSAA